MKIIYRISRIIGIFRKNIFSLKSGFRLKTGKRVSFSKRSEVLIENKGKIEIGEYSAFLQNVHIAAIGGEISVGKNTYFNRNANVVSRYKVYVGDNCAIGPNVNIYDHDHKFGASGKEKGFNTGEIYIGDNCWVGANVTILRGTHIGKNCVIGAGCVVKGEVPEGVLLTQGRELTFIKLRNKNNE